MSEKAIINEKSLKQAIGFISELDFNNEDYNQLYEIISPIFEDKTLKEKLKNVMGENETGDLNEIMNLLIENLNIKKDMLPLLEKIIKDPKIVDSIQDMFLEKLI